MSRPPGRVLAMVAVLLVASLAGGSFVGSVAAADSATITPSSHDSGDVVNHTVTLSPDDTTAKEEGTSLSAIAVYYSATDVSNVSQTDVVYVKVSTDNDSAAEKNLTDKVQGVDISDNGHTLTVQMSDSQSLDGGHTYYVKYGDVRNPTQPGNYTVEADFNPQSLDNPASATLEVTDDTPPEVGVDLFTAGGQASQDVDVNVTANEALGSFTVEVGDDHQETLTKSEFTRVQSGDTYVYRANVTSGEDGHYTATVTDAADTEGNSISDTPSDELRVDTVPVAVVNGTVAPETVAPNTTVDHDLTVSVDDFSTDGGTDTVRVDFANATDVSLGNVTATNATVSNATLADAGAETVAVDLDTGDGGGTTDVTVSLNATVNYPSTIENETLPVAATALDSDGDEDTDSNVTAVYVNESGLAISNFTLYTVGGTDSQRVNLSFVASDELDTVSVDVSGATNGTLTRGDFTLVSASADAYNYTANVTSGEDGTYHAVLSSATDTAGDRAYEDDEDALTVNTVPVTVVGGNVTPDPVGANETTTLNVSVQVADFNRDGGTDEVHVHVNDSFAADYALAGASANGSTAVTNATTMDCDGDGDADCTHVSLDTGDDGGLRDVTVELALQVRTPAVGNETYPFHAHAFDSDGDDDMASNVTSVTVVDRPPHITNFTLVRVGGPDSQAVDLLVNATEPLPSLQVSLSGAANGTLTRADFTETDAGEHVYRANVSAGEDGEFVADLDAAAETDGDHVPNDHRDTLLVNTVPVDVVNVSTTPTEVVAGDRVVQSATVDVESFARDGGTDVVTVRFPDAAAGTLSVRNATAVATNASANNSTTLWTAEPNATAVDGADADTAADTVRVPVDTGDGGGLVDVTVSVAASLRYAEDAAGETLPVGAAAYDSDGDSDVEPTMADVTVVAPTTDTSLEPTSVTADSTLSGTTSVTTLNETNVTTNETANETNTTNTTANRSSVTLVTNETALENWTGAALDAVNVSANFSGAPALNVSATASSPTGVAVGNASVDALTYFTVTHEVNDSRIRSAALTFAVDTESVADPSRVAVYRYGDGAWNRLNATLVGQSNGEYRYRVELSHLSRFALAVDDPDGRVQQSETTSTTTTASTTTQASDSTTATSSPTETKSPGFGVASALVAALVAALLAGRRR